MWAPSLVPRGEAGDLLFDERAGGAWGAAAGRAPPVGALGRSPAAAHRRACAGRGSGRRHGSAALAAIVGVGGRRSSGARAGKPWRGACGRLSQPRVGCEILRAGAQGPGARALGRGLAQGAAEGARREWSAPLDAAAHRRHFLLQRERPPAGGTASGASRPAAGGWLSQGRASEVRRRGQARTGRRVGLGLRPRAGRGRAGVPWVARAAQCGCASAASLLQGRQPPVGGLASGTGVASAAAGGGRVGAVEVRDGAQPAGGARPRRVRLSGRERGRRARVLRGAGGARGEASFGNWHAQMSFSGHRARRYVLGFFGRCVSAVLASCPSRGSSSE